MDGEGSIMQRHGKQDDGIWIVRVSMTCKPLIEWLAGFGGTFHKPSPDRRGRTPQFQWMVARQSDVDVLLRTLLPHLRVRRDRAQDCLADLAARRPQ